MQKLVRGIHQFQANYFPSHRELFERIADQQKPLALFITCSDSRVNPNLITDTEPGELFILRNAGNLVPPHGSAATGGEAATIEYAVAGLETEHVIVCGHTGCGAMGALLDPTRTANLPRMRQWLTHAEATAHIVAASYPHLTGEDRLTVTVEENVLVQLENLRTHPVVAARLATGKLKLHGWVYKIKTGEVFAYEAVRGQFVPVTEVSGLPEDIRPRLATAANACGHDHNHDLLPANASL